MKPRESLAAPFRAERYADLERLGSLIAPPYDVLGPEERTAYAGRHPHNVVHLVVPEGGEARYARAKALWNAWRAEGVFQRDADAGVTVLRQAFVTPGGVRRVRTGVILGVAAEPFAEGRVLPHERTHAEPKADRLALLRATHAMFEALLMVAPDREGLLEAYLTDAVGGEPLATASLEGTEIALWQVTGTAGAQIAEAASAGALYIADGHHRFETAVAFQREYAPALRLPALVVPAEDPGLVVLATHRIILGGRIELEAVVEAVRGEFHVHELPPDGDPVRELSVLRARGPVCAVVLPEGRAVALLRKAGAPLGGLAPDGAPVVQSLDVTRVDGIVVRRLLAAAGPDASLEYSADPEWARTAPARGDAAAAVLLNPTALEAVLAVADAGAVMPQKSTYFQPKVPSGLLVMDYDGG